MDKKAITKKVAKWFVDNKETIIKKLNSYGCKLNFSSTNKAVLNCFLYNVYNNNDFAKYVNKSAGLDNAEYSNWIGAVLGTLGGLFGGGNNAQEQAELEQQILILEAEKKARRKKTFLIIGVAVGVIIILTAIIIIRRRKNKAK